MTKSQFEDLPNELLTDIFKNLDARNLFRAFGNLNSRINQLIQSFQYLKLFCHLNQSNLLKTNEEFFSYYVHTLIVNSWINFNLQHFPNVQRKTRLSVATSSRTIKTSDDAQFETSVHIICTYDA